MSIQSKKLIGDFIPQSLESFSLSLSIHFPGIPPHFSVQQPLVLLELSEPLAVGNYRHRAANQLSLSHSTNYGDPGLHRDKNPYLEWDSYIPELDTVHNNLLPCLSLDPTLEVLFRLLLAFISPPFQVFRFAF
jgi:hypothetical protein